MKDFLRVENLAVRAGTFQLESFSLEVREGESVSLMGPSGCGKTTLLEVICGLRSEWVSEGRIFLAGEEITHDSVGSRGVGLVPQDVVLFPKMTVRENMEFGLKLHGWRKVKVRERVEALAESLGLVDLLGRMPLRLSGGEARRVALGRALALRPRLLCLDEALGGLDEARHEEVVAMIRRVVEQEKVTLLHVTHSRAEASALGGRICEML